MPLTTTARRRGFTLVELLVALLLAGLVTAALLAVLVRQQRFYADAARLIEARGQTRQAASILPNDLRAISPAAGDLIAMGDAAIDLRATVGSAVACGIGSRTLDLPPLDLAANTLAAWSSRPREGDEVHVLDDVTGELRTYSIVGVEAGGAWCPGTPFTDPVRDAGKQRHRITVASGLAPGIVRGSPMRITRRVRYTLYRSPSDGEWYLGYAELNPSRGSFDPVQPLSGPYRPYAADGTSGISFRYLDAAGDAVAPTEVARVARIDVVVRGITRGLIRTGGMRALGDGRYADADSVSVAIRNRW